MDFPDYPSLSVGDWPDAPSDGVIARNDGQEQEYPGFSVENVELQFDVSGIVDLAAANNMLCIATSKRILRIDLNNPENIEEIDLPRKSAGHLEIKQIFLDPTGSHLIATTTDSPENYYVGTEMSKFRHLTRLKGLPISAVGWNPDEPTNSTKEILLGTSEGGVYETCLDPGDEYFKRDERYLKPLWKESGTSIDGIFIDKVKNTADMHQILVRSGSSLWYLHGKTSRKSNNDGPLYSKLFHSESSLASKDYGVPIGPLSSHGLEISPDKPGHKKAENYKAFAFLAKENLICGRLASSNLSISNESVFDSCETLSLKSHFNNPSAIKSFVLSEYHYIALSGFDITAVNRLSNKVVYKHTISSKEDIVGLRKDIKNATVWAFTPTKLYEIVISQEDYGVWKAYLERGMFREATSLARTFREKDEIYRAHGKQLLKEGNYEDAAEILGSSTEPLEDIAIKLMEDRQPDALRKFLLSRLKNMSLSAITQRIMLSSWIIELYIEKLNNLDERMAAKKSENTAESERRVAQEKDLILNEYQTFVKQHKGDLDQDTTYETLSNFGRREELLYYASSLNDVSFVLSYWVRQEMWHEATKVLAVQREPDIFYRYATVLLVNNPIETVNLWMGVPFLDPERLIPALASYDQMANVPIEKNQAVRYLLYSVNRLGSKSSAVHNLLLSIYSRSDSTGEKDLLEYLKRSEHYDREYALRLCLQSKKIKACAYILSSLSLYREAVDICLDNDELELACLMADKPTDNELRKSLWLKIAEGVIQTKNTAEALSILKKCELLKIEDLIPFFSEFVVIDDVKDEVCQSLETYSREIDSLRKEMDAAIRTADNVKNQIKDLNKQQVKVEPGASCKICDFLLVSRQFYMFPCRHGFHADCLVKQFLANASTRKKRQLQSLRTDLQSGRANDQLDSIIAADCLLCGETMISSLDQPFVDSNDAALEAAWQI